MIDVSLDNGQFFVALEHGHVYYERVYMLVRTLLSSREVSNNVWSVSHHDLETLKAHLDRIGLTVDRTIEDSALEALSVRESRADLNDRVKRGDYNEWITKELGGRCKSEPYFDQLAGIAFGVYNWRVGIFDPMGLGKSLEALGVVVALGDNIKRTLVICPYTVQIGFLREIQKHTHLKSIAIPSGRAKAVNFLNANRDGDWDIMLVHPENLIQSGKHNVLGELTKILRSMPWDMVIADEFHLYKNMAAKRTQCVLEIMNNSKDHLGNIPRVQLITGTPVSESPLNAYVALSILAPEVLPSEARFETHFVEKKLITFKRKDPKTKKTRRLKVPKVMGFKNLVELKRLLESVSIRRKKSNLTGFPEQVFTVRPASLDARGFSKQLAICKVLCGEIVAELSSESRVNLSRFLTENTTVLRLKQCLNHPALLDEEGDSAKYCEVDALLEELLVDPDAKVVIWTEYRKAVDLLFERYDKKYGAVKIYGGVTNEQLEGIKDRFENEARPRVAVCIPAKAGTGVDFLARARTAIYIERPLSFVQYKQSLDRIHRRVDPTSTTKLDLIRSEPATLIFIDVPGTVDELGRDKLMGKQEMVDEVDTDAMKRTTMGRRELMKYLKI